jgi:hypothetical protein
MSCPKIDTLQLAGIKGVDDELMMSLAKNCPKLTKANLKGCDHVS